VQALNWELSSESAGIPVYAFTDEHLPVQHILASTTTVTLSNKRRFGRLKKLAAPLPVSLRIDRFLETYRFNAFSLYTVTNKDQQQALCNIPCVLRSSPGTISIWVPSWALASVNA
jgi:hypothetical protein